MAEKQKFCDDQLIPALSLLDKYFKGKKFCAGEKVSYVDFMLWEMLDHFQLFDEAVFDGLRNDFQFKATYFIYFSFLNNLSGDLMIINQLVI